jgi:hypothetical protein
MLDVTVAAGSGLHELLVEEMIMNLAILLRPLSTLIASTALAFPTSAAELEKYLPDDTDMVLSINVKQIVATPVFAKTYQKHVEEFLKTEPLPTILKDTGLDPLKDVDRVVVAMGRRSHEPEEEAGSFAMGGPLILYHGRFDAARLRGKGKQLAETMPKMTRVHTIGDTQVFEFVSPPAAKGFVAILDDSHLATSGSKKLLEEALAKASGKKKTKLKHEAFQKLLKTLDEQTSAALVASSSMIVGSRVSVRAVNGKQTREVQHHNLGDSGVESLQVSATFDKDIKVRAVIGAKNAAGAEILAKSMTDGLKEAMQHIKQEAATEKELVPVVGVLETVRTTTKDDTITLEGHGSGEAMVALVKAYFMGKPVTPPPQAVPKPSPN